MILRAAGDKIIHTVRSGFRRRSGLRWLDRLLGSGCSVGTRRRRLRGGVAGRLVGLVNTPAAVHHAWPA